MLNSNIMNRKNLSMYVDADSCPVKEEIIQLCQTYSVEMIFVSSYAHVMTLPSSVKQITVDTDKEAADLYIMNHIQRGDFCVTQDHALASLLLPRGAEILSPRGMMYTNENIDQLLNVRYLSQKQRRMGGKTKGPKAFTEEDRRQFISSLEKILAKKEGL
ncbi:YaiI/YqxD family protein [Bacillus solitudinis]|uniref:YaiI/YqxD family protein n=1 Tax=Bacillus solitudinis TaxID=2014074 RepID=UPI000C23F2E2|nr:YaiI/YqxD family protein [Bacillus solitudinis]